MCFCRNAISELDVIATTLGSVCRKVYYEVVSRYQLILQLREIRIRGLSFPNQCRAGMLE
jgi:hypothetical protein